jgi:hypothetical protein
MAHGDTSFRRRSSAITEVQLESGIPAPPTGSDTEEEEGRTEHATYERFEQQITNQIDQIRYTETTETIEEDLRERVIAIAEQFDTENGPTMPFVQMVDEPKSAALPRNPAMNAEAFIEMVETNPLGVFKEFKARAILLMAYSQQVAELHNTAVTLDDNMKLIHDWVPALDANRDEPVRSIEPDREAQLLASAAEQDARITELQEQVAEQNQAIADLVIQNRSTRESTVGTHRSSSVLTAGGSNGRSAKQPDPAIFYNDKDKDTVEFEVWHRQLCNKLKTNNDHFVDDAAKQSYVEGRIGGKAARELAPYLRDTHPEPIDTSEKLIAHLWREYYDTRSIPKGTAPSNTSKKLAVPSLSKEEVRKLYDEGRCFTCREKGHLSTDCPQKAAGGDAKAAREARIQQLQAKFAVKD